MKRSADEPGRRARLRIALATLGLLAGAVAACGPESNPARAPARPPVVLVVLDALAAGHVGHLGYERPTTPNLDALAADGVTFTNAFAPAPYTQASIPSILTGLWPDRHLVRRTGDSLAERHTTLTELLARAGYRAFGACASMNGSSMIGITQGFESFRELFRKDVVAQERMRANGKPKPRVAIRARDELHLVGAEVFLPALEGWIEALEPGDTPFFYLHILEPHSPYQPPEPFRSRFIDPGYDGPFAGGDNKTLIASLGDELDAKAQDVAATRALYDANLAYVDDVMERAFERLRTAGLWDEALVIVTSDHGEAFWQHGIWGHNEHLFDEMLHVPLVVRFPESRLGERPVGVRSDALVSPLDLVPSICAWLELAVPRRLDGAPLDVTGSGDPARVLFARSNHADALYAIRTRDHKLIRSASEEDGEPVLAFFDLARDPAEQRPLEPTGPVADELRERLGAQLRTFERWSSEGRAEAHELSPEEREHLEALGYTE